MLFYVLFIGRIAKRCFHFFPALRRKKFAKKQRNESIDGTNAVVVANVREGKNELIPGFFPLTFTNVGRCLRLVSYAVRTVLRLWLRAFRPRSSLPSLFCLIESVFIIPAV